MANSSTASIDSNAMGSQRLMVLLAMAMFVLVVDTSIMNVSISAVVEDLDTTVSGVQGAIALEALVSASFILIGSKIGDLYGRKRAYMLGLMGYAIGALAMTLTQTLLPVIIFWAIIGGLGAALLLPAMQSLIHSNFEGAAMKRTYALVGAATGIAAAVGPLLGGFITTYLSWRVSFALEFVIIAVVLLNLKLVKDAPYTGPREIDGVGALLSILGMGGIVLSILVWQEGGAYVGLLMAVGAVAMGLFIRWLRKRKKENKTALLDIDLFKSKYFRLGVTEQMLQNVALGGMMIVLPIYFQMVFEYTAMQTGLAMAPLSLSIFLVSLMMGRRAGKRRASRVIQIGYAILALGLVALLPIIPRADSGWMFVIPLIIVGCGLGLLVSQINNYTLSPISEEKVSEAAGVNSAAGSFGLSFGLAFAGAMLLAALTVSFTNMANASTVLSTEQQAQVAAALEEDAQLMSTTQLDAQIEGQPAEVEAEILRINTEASYVALQVALLIPLLASILGLLNSFRMVKMPDPEPSSAAEMVLGG
jgi:EmrB/QacA subfamily drug resistance transporter